MSPLPGPPLMCGVLRAAGRSVGDPGGAWWPRGACGGRGRHSQPPSRRGCGFGGARASLAVADVRTLGV